MQLEAKIATFINKALTKHREIATLLLTEFDRQGYQSVKSRDYLTKISQTRNFLELLVSEKKGGLTDLQISQLIDFYYKWLELEKVITVNYTNYSILIDGSYIIVAAGLYALQADLLAEISGRMAADLDIIDNFPVLVKLNKVAHGFAVKDVLTIDPAGVLIKVSDPANERRIGIVVEVIDANNFRLQIAGYVRNISGLVAGTTYYAQASGTIGTTVTDMIVLVSSSTTSGYMLPTSLPDETKKDNVVSTAGGTINLDLKNTRRMFFKAPAAITGTKIWAILNDLIAKEIPSFRFSISGLTPGAATHDQTMPAGAKLADARISAVGPPIVWRPVFNGNYEMTATKDGSEWWIRISDVF